MLFIELQSVHDVGFCACGLQPGCAESAALIMLCSFLLVARGRWQSFCRKERKSDTDACTLRSAAAEGAASVPTSFRLQVLSVYHMLGLDKPRSAQRFLQVMRMRWKCAVIKVVCCVARKREKTHSEAAQSLPHSS